MENRKSFILYTDTYEAILDLTQEEKGNLLDAIYLYAMGEEVDMPKGEAAMAWKFIRIALDRNEEKWEEIKKKRSEAGKRHTGNQYTRQNGTNGTSVPKMEQMEQNGTNGTVNVNVNDNVNVNVNNIPSTKVDVSDLPSDAAVTPQMVVDEWNRATKGIWGTIKSIDTSSTRWKMVRARIASEGWEGFKAAILTATQSQYLTGGEATWFSFDWFIKPNNYVKVRDGNYMNTSKNNNNGKCTTDTQRRRGAALDIAGFTEEDYSEPL